MGEAASALVAISPGPGVDCSNESNSAFEAQPNCEMSSHEAPHPRKNLILRVLHRTIHWVVKGQGKNQVIMSLGYCVVTVCLGYRGPLI